MLDYESWLLGQARDSAGLSSRTGEHKLEFYVAVNLKNLNVMGFEEQCDVATAYRRVPLTSAAQYVRR